MIEEIFKLTESNNKTIEKILIDENIIYAHMILNEKDEVPEHFTDSNVYMTVVKGALSIALGDQEYNEYSTGTLLKIPVDTKMTVKNESKDPLELIVVKAPVPVGK